MAESNSATRVDFGKPVSQTTSARAVLAGHERGPALRLAGDEVRKRDPASPSPPKRLLAYGPRRISSGRLRGAS